jgi:NADPH-dependent 7-cyano-7-deazaguanine reductase QueF
MKPNTYVILQRAVEEGALLGYRRAFKRVENPTEEQIVDVITDAVMLTVSEVFDFTHQSGDSYL